MNFQERQNIIHITNGQSAVELLRAGGIKGEIFSWDDVLHEGPLPSGLTFEAFSAVRAKYISQSGYGSINEITQKFNHRDQQLKNSLNFDKIMLWFEHDLYDQLQLMQILNWYSHQKPINISISLVNPDKHLGHHYPQEVSTLLKLEKKLSSQDLTTAHQVWTAITQSSPDKLNQLLHQKFISFPYLSAALIRLAQEYPDSISGLPKTEYLIIKCLEQSPLNLVQIFRKYSDTESAAFLGDSTFFKRLDQIRRQTQPLIHVVEKIESNSTPKSMISEQQSILRNIEHMNAAQVMAFYRQNAKKITVNITENAKHCLNEETDWFYQNRMEKWIGGCHISRTNQWYFDSENRQIVKRTRPKKQ